jgi:glutamate decarboxylase
MDLTKLRRKLKSLKSLTGKERTKVLAIVGIAGTTETGNIDPLDQSGTGRGGSYYHVDACWGLGLSR